MEYFEVLKSTLHITDDQATSMFGRMMDAVCGNGCSCLRLRRCDFHQRHAFFLKRSIFWDQKFYSASFEWVKQLLQIYKLKEIWTAILHDRDVIDWFLFEDEFVLNENKPGCGHFYIIDNSTYQFNRHNPFCDIRTRSRLTSVSLRPRCALGT